MPSIVLKCAEDDRIPSSSDPSPFSAILNGVFARAIASTLAHSSSCSTSDSTLTPAVAHTYSGVLDRSLAGTFSTASVSMGSSASAISASVFPLSDASASFDLTFSPTARSAKERGGFAFASPGSTRNVCARQPVDPASTITT